MVIWRVLILCYISYGDLLIDVKCISYGDLKSFNRYLMLCISYGDLKSFNRYLMLNA